MKIQCISSLLLLLRSSSITSATTIQETLPHPASSSSNENRRSTEDIIIPNPNDYQSIQRETSNRRYGLLDAEGIFIAINALAKAYPFLATLTSTQELYGLPAVGNDTDCTYEHNFDRRRELDGDGSSTGCYTWILIIEDKLAHQAGSDSGNRLPEVFINGAMHGDEMVGPTVAVETASLLLDAAHCESMPHGMEPKSEDVEKWTRWEDDLRKARVCRKEALRRGISDVDRKWLARLVTTRRIVIVPTANALGFYRGVHDENGLHPKDDFPFDLKASSTCMKTITARGINELSRNHMFQIAISFHAGESAIGYSWGSPAYLKSASPDAEANEMIATGFSDFGGEFSWMKHDPYPYGPINDQFGPKRGRMEDWAYAASWVANEKDMQCHPTTYGGYEGAKTVYTGSMLRTLTFMVDTSRAKTPPRDHLGTDHDLFNPKSTGNGHIPRNIRLALMAIDVVQPYLAISSLNGLDIQDDIVPLSIQKNRMCKNTKSISIPQGTEFVTIEWLIGGGFTVDTTSLMYGKWSDIPDEIDGYTQPSEELMSTLIDKVDGENGYKTNSIRIAPGGSRGQTSRWYNNKQTSQRLKLGPVYASSIETLDFNQGDAIAVFAIAQLDKSWVEKPKDETVSPKDLPQSHLVNARTNPSWFHYNNDHIIEGRLKWFSIPVTINIGPPTSITQETSVRISSVYIRQEKRKTILRSFFIACGVVIIWCMIGFGIHKARRNYLKQRGKEYSSILQDSEKSMSRATLELV